MVFDFCSVAKEVLVPTLAAFGYRLTGEESRRLVFSGTAELMIYQGERSSTIGLDLKLPSGDSLNLCNLEDFARAQLPGMTVRDEELGIKRLYELREFLSERCAAILRLDQSAIQAAIQLTNERNRRYNHDMVVSPAVELARKAFVAKSYREVVGLLAPLEADLQGSEIELLRLARKHEKKD